MHAGGLSGQEILPDGRSERIGYSFSRVLLKAGREKIDAENVHLLKERIDKRRRSKHTTFRSNGIRISNIMWGRMQTGFPDKGNDQTQLNASMHSSLAVVGW